MTIKVQCGCGAKFAFDVEPQNGVMPFPVNCPVCNADGTAAANQIIAEQESQPRLRMKAGAAPAPPPPGETIENLPPPRAPSGDTMKRYKAEARETRKGLLLASGVVLLVLALAGGWAWYSFVGCKPRMDFSMKLPDAESGWRTEFLPDGKVLMASANKVIMRDFHTHQELWSATIPKKGEGVEQAPQILVDKQSIWLCPGDQVVRLDRQNGEVKLTVPITGQLASFTPTESSLLVVSATDETRRVAMRIDLASGETSSQEVEVPRAQKHAMPDELPPNVAPTAGVLLAQATEDQKFNKPLDAISSEFFSAGQNLVELRVRLTEPKVNWVKSIKPRGPTRINGNTTASTSLTATESEVFNDIKRDRTGGVKSVDESTYNVRLRRWIGEKPVEWHGDVHGVPAFFSLQTVDLLVAGTNLIVFDKQNKKLFGAALHFRIGEEFNEDNFGHKAPAVERAGVLYIYDQGGLTAFSIPDGQVGWQLTSVGISQVQFDDHGALYIDSTGASVEDIQYSDQIKLQAPPAILLKVDPRSGRVLWQVQNSGQHCFLSGKYVYGWSGEMGGVGLAVGLAQAVNAPRPGAPTYFHIFRLNPENGKLIWRFFREEAPEEVDFQKNHFVMRFGNEVQGWSFLDL